jgi:hypothetical protein
MSIAPKAAESPEALPIAAASRRERGNMGSSQRHLA